MFSYNGVRMKLWTPVFHSHPQGESGRRGDHLAQAAAARGPRAQAGRRPLHLPAARPARAAARSASSAARRWTRAGAIELWMPHLHPAEYWRQGPRWAAAREIMYRADHAGDGRSGAGRARVRARTDPRGDHHPAGQERDHQLPRPAEELLPDRHQVPERDPPALRPDARPRVRDEGRLLVRRRRRRRDPQLPRDEGAPTRGSSRAAG